MSLLQKIGIKNIRYGSRSVDDKSPMLDYVLLIPITLSQKLINVWLICTRNLTKLDNKNLPFIRGSVNHIDSNRSISIFEFLFNDALSYDPHVNQDVIFLLVIQNCVMSEIEHTRTLGKVHQYSNTKIILLADQMPVTYYCA